MGSLAPDVNVGALRSAVAAATLSPLIPGHTWHVVSAAWVARLADAADPSPSPGPIDSSALAAEPALTSPADWTPLRTDIVPQSDYQLLPAATWDALAAAFGTTGPTFPRHVIPGMAAGAERVELWPPSVRLLRVVRSGTVFNSLPQTTLVVSVATPLSAFKNLVRSSLQLAQVSDSDIRLFRVSDGIQTIPLDSTSLGQLQPELVNEQLASSTSSDPTLEMLQALDGLSATLAVDVRTGGVWAYDDTSSLTAPAAESVKGVFANNKEDHWSALQANSQKAYNASQENGHVASVANGFARAPSALRLQQHKQGPKGLVGLQNLGNTCFMNSALQCLSNTPEVQEYFVSNVFQDEINRDNPLGNGGALAEAFGALLQRIWSPKTAAGGNKGLTSSRYGGGWHNAVNPREFKFAVSRFAPQFAGYGQQDTQELLAFLLDGLHEDLNRIKKKPYFEAPDWEGGDDRALVEFARKQWDLYKARNDSLIVDLFQGQYKSTLVCPECKKVAIKFDPFMYLTLPIPNRRQWTGSIIFVPYDPTQPSAKLKLSMPQDSTIAQLRAKVGAAFGVNKDHLLGGEVWMRNIQKWYLDWDSVADLGSTDVAYFWELPVPVRFPPTKQKSFVFGRAHTLSATDYERNVSPAAYPSAGDWVILPVFTMLALVANAKVRIRRTKSALPLGIPFFAAIPPEQKNDPEAVARIVEWQYTRYAQSPESFRKIVQAPSGDSSAAAAPSQPDTVAGTPSVSSAEQEDDVKSVTMDEADVASEPKLEQSQQESENSATQSETAPENVTPSQPSPAAYKMYYLARRLNTPLPQSGQAYEEMGELLTERSERRQEGSAWQNLVTKSSSGDDVEQPWPLVYTSGAVVCVWTTAAAKAAFIRSEHEVWGPYEEKLDESITTTQGRAGSKRDQSLWDCLNEFTRAEQLGADDLWYCAHCKEFRQATKKFDLWKVPDILVVHLKRFSAARYSRDKIDDYVDFPITGLDLSEYVQGSQVISQLEKEGNNPITPVAPTVVPPTESFLTQPPSELGAAPTDRSEARALDPDHNDDAVASDYPIYDLYAVDNHYGGLGGGHYTACARNPEDGQWYYYDDSSVRPIKPEEAKTRAAYLLFYRRRTTRAIGGKTRQRLDESLSSLAGSTDTLHLPNQAHGSLLHGGSSLSAPLGPNGLPEADAANDPYASSSSLDASISDDEPPVTRKRPPRSSAIMDDSSSSEPDADESVRPSWRPQVTTVPVSELEEVSGKNDHFKDFPASTTTSVPDPMEVDTATQLSSNPSTFYS